MGYPWFRIPWSRFWRRYGRVLLMILWVAEPVMFTLRLGFAPIVCRVFTIPSILLIVVWTWIVHVG